MNKDEAGTFEALCILAVIKLPTAKFIDILKF